MARILVTGGGGQLGRAVVRSLTRAGLDVDAPDHAHLDVCDADGLAEHMQAVRPEVVIDLALPRGPDGGFDQVATAAGHVAEAAHTAGAYSIYLSCAEVFSGVSDAPYVESDRPDPRTPLGMAKLDGEQAVACANRRYALLRSSWIFGPGGDNPVEDVLCSAERDPTRVVADATVRSCPTPADSLAEAMIALVRSPAYGVVHLAGAGPCTRHQLARTVLRAAGNPANVVALTADCDSPPEVKSLVLGSRRAEVPPLPDWRLGIAGYLAARESLRRR